MNSNIIENWGSSDNGPYSVRLRYINNHGKTNYSGKLQNACGTLHCFIGYYVLDEPITQLT